MPDVDLFRILAVRFRSPVELLPLDPSYKPMASATEAERAKIWGLVLKHVIKLKDTSIHAALAAQLLDDDDFDMWVHEDTDDDFGLDLDEEDDWDSGYAHRGRYGRAVKCMLVSKEFRVRAAARLAASMNSCSLFSAGRCYEGRMRRAHAAFVRRRYQFLEPPSPSAQRRR